MGSATATPTTTDAVVVHRGRNLSAMAATAAVLGIVGDLYHVTFDRVRDAAVFKLHGILLIAALALLVALALALREHLRLPDRVLGRVGTALAALGTMLVVGDVYYEVVVTPGLFEVAPAFVEADLEGWHLLATITSFALFGGGWFLTALGLGSAGVVTRATAAVLAIGGLLAFTPLPGSYLVLFGAIALVARDLREPARVG